jgi:hypothetical protein
MIVAAALAALIAAGERCGLASATRLSRTTGLRLAMPQATSRPYFCCAVRVSSPAMADRFSQTSLAKSGSCCFRASIDIGGLLASP